jgi:transcriptional regulator with XRE-family HTH domain
MSNEKLPNRQFTGGAFCAITFAMTTLGDRLKYFRAKAGFNQDTAADRITMSSGNLGRIERNERGVTAERLEQFAKLYKCTVADFYQDVDQAIENDTIPIVGYLNDQGKITASKDEANERADAYGIAGVDIVAIQVKKPVYPHFFADDIILYDRGKSFRPKLYMNKQCIVEISRVTTVIGVLTRGRTANSYTIVPYTGAPIEDTKILAAYPIILIKHKQL